jgi:hypothetical protein
MPANAGIFLGSKTVGNSRCAVKEAGNLFNFAAAFVPEKTEEISGLCRKL